MDNLDAIVIGGGLGGLIAGAKLVREGRKVVLLEQHYIPGGCATTFKRKDFVFEVGLHEMDGLDKDDLKHNLFKELEIFENIELKKVPEFYRIYSTGSQNDIDFILPDNVEEAKKVLIKEFPKEKKGINKFFKTILGIRNNINFWEKLKPWQRKILFPIFPIIAPYLALSTNKALTIVAKISPLFWLFRPDFLFWKYYDIGTYLDAIIKDEKLKIILTANIGYYHDDPYTMSLVYFGVAQSSYFKGGGWYIKGGSQKLSNYLAEYISKKGGKVIFGKKVTSIITEGDKAIGIKYQNTYDKNSKEEELFANVIIANAAIPNIVELLNSQNKEKLQQQTQSLKHSCSLLSIYVGFKKNLSKDFQNPAYSTFIFKGMNKQGDFFSGMQMNNLEKGFVFVDYSKIDSGLCPEGKTVGTFCTIDYLSNWENLSEEEYKTQKEKVAQAFIERLNNILPGIKDEVEYYEVATPKTIQRYTLNPSGSPYGYAQLPQQAASLRIDSKSLIKNLYFSSAWTFPGGGFTGAILAGNVCARKVLSTYKKNETSTLPLIADTQSTKLLVRKEIAKDTFELEFEKTSDFNYFKPGQYAVVTLTNPNDNILDMPLRSLSIVSHPDDKTIKFAMRKSNSAFKRSCLAMEIGDDAKLYGPMGNFTLSNNKNPLVFLISGIGITPIISMLKDLEKKNFEQEVYLFYSNRNIEKTAYHKEIQQFKLKHFKYIPIFTGTQGRLNENQCKKELKKDWNVYSYFIVGTSGFLQSMLEILEKNKVDKAKIKVDDFG